MRQTKTVRAQQNTCNAQSKEGETILSSHKKGTAMHSPISQERGQNKQSLFLKPTRLLCHLTRKVLKQTKTPNKIVATDHKMRVDLWNLVTTCGMALRLEILIAGGSVSPQAWSSGALKGYSNIFLIALETRPVLYNG